MRKFLRSFALAVVVGLIVISQARAQGSATASQPWFIPAATDGVTIRVDGRAYVVSASISSGSFHIYLPVNTPTVFVSIRAVDGGFLPETMRATTVSLVSGNRQIWRSALNPAYFWRFIWLPPGGIGQYQALTLPSLRENSSLVARIEIRTTKGTSIVKVPVRVPPAYAYPFDLNPSPGV